MVSSSLEGFKRHVDVAMVGLVGRTPRVLPILLVH